jgi:hypothetical protein
VVIVASLLALTGGLLELGRAFRDAGMAPRWRRVDWVWLLLIACLAVPVVIHRERMGDSASGIAAMRYLQSLSSVLLAVPVIVALGLHRISRSMAGGRWAVALRWMVAFLLVRLVNLYLGTALAITSEWIQWSNVGAPWLFTMAAMERWSVTRAAWTPTNRHKIASLMHAEIGSLVAGSLAECGVRTGAGFVRFVNG